MSYYFNDDKGYYNLYSNVFSPAFIYNQAKVGGDCDGGLYFETFDGHIGAFNFLMKNGVCKWSDMPYYYSDCYCYNIPDETQKAKAKNYKIEDYYSINSSTVRTIKNVLYRGDPIIIAVDTDEDFYYLGNEVWKPDCTKEPEGRHAMLIVGYSDNRRAFKILNSYGNEWGDCGYLWLSYDCIDCISEAFVIVPDYNNLDSDEEITEEVYYEDSEEIECDEWELLFD